MNGLTMMPVDGVGARASGGRPTTLWTRSGRPQVGHRPPAARPVPARLCPGERLPGRRLIAGVTLTRERQASGDRSNTFYSPVWGFREQRPPAYAGIRYRLSPICPADRCLDYEDATTAGRRIARQQGRERVTDMDVVRSLDRPGN